MRLEIIGSPKRARLSSLSFNIAKQALIGISDDCDLQLPPYGPLNGDDAKIVFIKGNWFVEALMDQRVAVNSADAPLEKGQRVLLSQDDMLFIRGYHLKVSLGQDIKIAQPIAQGFFDDIESLCSDASDEDHQAQVKRAKLIKAMEFALEQALVELEPWRVEKHVKDRTKTPFGLKPNYWKGYQQYFDVLIADKTIQQKFFSCFWETVEKDGGGL